MTTETPSSLLRVVGRLSEPLGGLEMMANLVEDYSANNDNPNVSAWLRAKAVELREAMAAASSSGDLRTTIRAWFEDHDSAHFFGRYPEDSEACDDDCAAELAAHLSMQHEHDFRRTFVDGVVVDVRCACGAAPLDSLNDRQVR